MAEWACSRDGKCCTEPRFVVMTWAERREIEAAATHLPRRALQWRAGDRPSLTMLVTRPCPLYDAEKKGCTVYDVRPFNCRRFGCMRDDVTRETFTDQSSVILFRRRPDEQAIAATLRGLERLEADARPWALAHGWNPGWQ
jgi:Fe-S-cluster containining protein